jgi:hypothetical protein
MSGSQLGFSFLSGKNPDQSYILKAYEACPKCLDKNDEHYCETRSAMARKGKCYIHDKKSVPHSAKVSEAKTMEPALDATK